ncbi:MAG: hypothetical protein AAGC81_17015 [Pseudomonadota bacterium]
MQSIVFFGLPGSIAALACLALSGCASVAIEAVNVAADKVSVTTNLDDALGGDPDAQFAVGEALCCSGDAATGTLYNTTEAITWLCRSAEQGNTDAMQKLGQIFEGDQVDGLRILRRAFTATQETPKNPAAAYFWYAKAGASGEIDGAETARALYETLSLAERDTAARYFDGAPAPCEWNDLAQTIAPSSDARPSQ